MSTTEVDDDALLAQFEDDNETAKASSEDQAEAETENKTENEANAEAEAEADAEAEEEEAEGDGLAVNYDDDDEDDDREAPGDTTSQLSVTKQSGNTKFNIVLDDVEEQGGSGSGSTAAGEGGGLCLCLWILSAKCDDCGKERNRMQGGMFVVVEVGSVERGLPRRTHLHSIFLCSCCILT